MDKLAPPDAPQGETPPDEAAKLDVASTREDPKAAALARRESKAAAYAKAKAEARERAALRAQERAEAKAAARAASEEAARAKAAPMDATGKQRLVEAALRLHAEKRSFASLGIREIAREANLNPNTFYRHFESLDDLAVAAVLQIGERLRPMLQQIHRLATRVDPLTVAALEVAAFYAFALGNPEAFVVGVTEYHGGSPRVRESIATLLHEIAAEMRDNVAALGIFPTVSREHLEIACAHIVVHLFHLSQDYIEKPELRQQITEASELMIVWMFTGAALGVQQAASPPAR